MQKHTEEQGAVVWSAARYEPRANTIADLLRWLLQTPWRRLNYRIILVILIWLALSTFEVGRSSHAVNDTIHDTIMSITPPSTDSNFDGGVTVVLWTEAATRAFVEHGRAVRQWPIEYRAHAELLYTLLDYRPRVIFIDFAFLEKRPDEGYEALEDALRSATEAGIQVFVSNLPGAGATAFRELREATTGDGQPLVRFVPATISEEPVVRHYPIEIGTAHSAAVEIYNTLLANVPITRRTRNLSGREFAIHWYHSTNAATGIYFGGGKQGNRYCNDLAAKLRADGVRMDRIQQITAGCEFVGPLISDPRSSEAPPSALPVIPADAVVFEEQSPGEPPRCDGMRIRGAVPAERPIEERPMRDFLSCRVVMIGSGILAAGDVSVTPFSGFIPSVLIHAQALQNLFDGTAYFAQPDWSTLTASVPLLRGFFEHANVSLLVSVIFLVVWATLYSLYFEVRARRPFGRPPRLLPAGPLALHTVREMGLAGLIVIGTICSALALAIAALLLLLRVEPSAWSDPYAMRIVFGGASIPLAFDRLLLWAMYRKVPRDGLFIPPASRLEP